MEKMLFVSVILIGITWVILCFVKGRKSALQRESVCIETVNADITNIKRYHFFCFKYYSLTLYYKYNGEKHEVKKGWFGKLNDEKQIVLHINPKKPEECYLTKLKEKCCIK